MSNIKVLTLGWEFPPLVNGGLGIACLGLSKALAKKVDLRVIVPKADPSVHTDGFQLTGLNNVSYREVEQVDRKYSYESFAMVEHAPIELDPYTTVEGESGMIQFTQEGRISFSRTHEAEMAKMLRAEVGHNIAEYVMEHDAVVYERQEKENNDLQISATFRFLQPHEGEWKI